MKILIGYDGSRAADEALQDLKNAGLPKAAEARILCAVPPLLPLDALAPNGDGISWYATAYKEALESRNATEAHALAQAKDAAKQLKKTFPAWKITPEIALDVPAHALLLAAGQWKPDLIAIGSRGWNGFSKLILGSVADKVLNHARCPVRLGKPRKTAKSRPPRLLIAFDGSKYAEAAVSQAAGRAWPKGTQARLLAVSEFQLRMGDITLALSKTLGGKPGTQSAWPWMERKMAKAAARLEAAGVKTETTLMIGEPRHSLLSQAKKWDADTILLGSRGISGLQRFLLGSVSAAVAAHAPCSVEIVHLSARGKRA
jgi:nucleotide-binding universal stress UspA family protein